jgi:predicted nucleic acid-binding protein
MVVDEIQRGLEGGYDYLQPVIAALFPLKKDGWLHVLPLDSPQEQALYVELSASLGAGEASAITLAFIQKLTLATDDRAARRLATQRGIKLTGTVGILVRLVKEGYLTLLAGNELLRQMISLRYRSPVDKLDDLIR